MKRPWIKATFASDIMKLSVIIPTYQEEATIGELVEHLFRCDIHNQIEILVCDGGSTDDTLRLAEEAGAIGIKSPKKGRAAQLNCGASLAQAEILYFLHADAFPPKSFVKDVISAIDLGYDFGNFRQVIKSENPWVRINSYFSRLNGRITSGGDQSLFITRELFFRLKGYREDFLFMEDYDLFGRARLLGENIKIPKSLEIVDRKYTYNSYLRVNLSNLTILTLYRLGIHPNKLFPLYKSWIKGPRYKSLPE